MLQGKKTYLAAGLAVIAAIGTYLMGDASIADTAQLVLTAVLGATIRTGIANS